MPMPKIGITIGDPSGIGPEIVCKAVASMSPERQDNVLVIGDQNVIARANTLTRSGLVFSENQVGKRLSLSHVNSQDIESIQDGSVSVGGGHAAYSYVAHAADLAIPQSSCTVLRRPLIWAAVGSGPSSIAMPRICHASEASMP